MPAWLPTCFKHCLVTERHHKVLRRLLHLLATLPSSLLSSDTVIQPKSNNVDAAGLHQEVNAQQQTTGSDAHTIASSAAMPETGDTASQVSLATAASPSQSPPAASCSSFAPAITPSSFPATGGAQASVALTAAPCTAAALTAAVQQYEQISSVVAQARHPSVKREGLRCLGAAVRSVIAALMPNQDQQHSLQHSQQHSLAAVACVSGDQPSDSQHPSQDPNVRELGQTAADNARREQGSTRDSGSEEAQLKSSLLREAELRDSGSRSDSGLGLDPARPSGSFTSQHPPQISGRAQFEHETSPEAQQAQRDDQQTAYDLVDGFVALVSEYSEAQQFDDMRLAAATALAASGSHVVCPPMIAWFMLERCEATVDVLGEMSKMLAVAINSGGVYTHPPSIVTVIF